MSETIEEVGLKERLAGIHREKLNNLVSALRDTCKAITKTDAELEVAHKDLIEKVTNGEVDPVKLHNKINDLQGKKARLEATQREIEIQIPVVRETIYKAEQADYQSRIAHISQPANEVLDELIRTIEKLYLLACDYEAAELAVNIAWPPMDNWRGLHTKVMPVQSIRTQCDVWLGRPGFGNSIIKAGYTERLHVMDFVARRNYFNKRIDDTKKNTKAALDEKTLDEHRNKMREWSMLSLGIDPAEVNREPATPVSPRYPAVTTGEAIKPVKGIRPPVDNPAKA